MFAVVEVIAVAGHRHLSTVNTDIVMAGINFIPRYMAHLTYDISTEIASLSILDITL